MKQPEALPAKGFVPSARIPAIVETLASPGECLDDGIRTEMQDRFGFDFGNVRIHRDDSARRAADSVDARAFAYGQHIVLGVPSDRHLIAHELAHVVQTAGGSGGEMRLSTRGDTGETAAERAADAVVSGRTPQLSPGSVPAATLMRDERHKRGYAGEQQMGFTAYRAEDGWAFLEGPSGSAGHSTTARGFDGVAVRFEPTLEIHILDNKSLARSGNVSSATALTTNLQKNINDLITRISAANYQGMPASQVALVRAELVKARTSILTPGTPMPSTVRLVVTNAGGASTGVTSTLAARGVVFQNVMSTAPVATPPTTTPPTSTPPTQTPPTTPTPTVTPPTPTTVAASTSETAASIMEFLSEQDKANRRLVTVARVAKFGLAVLTIVGELHSAFAAMDMATSKMSGEGFMLGAELTRAQKLRETADKQLAAYDAYRENARTWRWTLYTMLLESNMERTTAAMWDALDCYNDLDDTVREFNRQISSLEALQALTEKREELAAKLLEMPLVLASPFVTTVFAAHEDLILINGALSTAHTTLITARDEAVSDQPFYMTYIRICLKEIGPATE